MPGERAGRGAGCAPCRGAELLDRQAPTQVLHLQSERGDAVPAGTGESDRRPSPRMPSSVSTSTVTRDWWCYTNSHQSLPFGNVIFACLVFILKFGQKYFFHFIFSSDRTILQNDVSLKTFLENKYLKCRITCLFFLSSVFVM